MEKDVTVHIYVLNWNQPELTVDCVQSLLNQTASIDSRIFIIDNGSTDESVNIFFQQFPKINVIRNDTNLGFQGGMNSGIQHALEAGVEYLLLLNNDTIAHPNMLQSLIDNFPEDADLVSPGIYFYENRELLCSLGGNFNPIFLEVLGKPTTYYNPPKIVQRYEFLPSHAWLIKTEVFNSVGLLDEIFFPIYYDDLDFCLRLKRLGHHAYLIPQAKIYHRASMSVGGRNSPKERYLMARNSGYYFRKNMKFWQTPLIFCFRIGSGINWTFRLLLQKNYESIKSYWKGFNEGWFNKLPKKKEKGENFNP
jgi:GT2 family glycosyltransferase